MGPTGTPLPRATGHSNLPRVQEGWHLWSSGPTQLLKQGHRGCPGPCPRMATPPSPLPAVALAVLRRGIRSLIHHAPGAARTLVGAMFSLVSTKSSGAFSRAAFQHILVLGAGPPHPRALHCSLFCSVTFLLSNGSCPGPSGQRTPEGEDEARTKLSLPHPPAR